MSLPVRVRPEAAQVLRTRQPGTRSKAEVWDTSFLTRGPTFLAAGCRAARAVSIRASHHASRVDPSFSLRCVLPHRDRFHRCSRRHARQPRSATLEATNMIHSSRRATHRRATKNRRDSHRAGRRLPSLARNDYFPLPWLSVALMNAATLSCSCCSDGMCAYTMCPDG